MKHLPLLLFLFSANCMAQVQLSDQAEISVITYGPWQGQLYSAFGHNSFRVNDPAHNIDYSYDYGVFDFNQPNFYLNFARGYLNYRVAVWDYKAAEARYIYFNRAVHEQKLNLTKGQKQRLFDYLQWNALPENQYYRYDYFYDNCATKMPDIIKKVFGDTVTFRDSHITTDYTIRELTDLYLTHQPWGDLGIDICLGLPMDKKATPYEYMFLPEYVEKGFANATITRDGVEQPLVKQLVRIYDPRDEDIPASVHPLWVFGAFFFFTAAVSYRDMKRKKPSTLLDALLFGVLGVIGVLLFFLWLGTDHRAAARNLNLLWALPTHVVAMVALLRNPNWLKTYFLITAVLSIALLVAWPFLPQQLHYALIPIVMAAGLRAYVQFRLRTDAAPGRASAGTADHK